ncbi:MAG TPA: SCP2 sterol-binding domain-containing protein [Ktedonobacterales bacterium]|nr:SCP2 sterol-binding domain-containing protein [Ktedonobacterales bacterium]
MATKEELREAIDDYVLQAQKSEGVQRSLKSWSCVISIEATDIGADFTMALQNGKATVEDGIVGTPDLIIRGGSEDLTNIFWCDENPASNYMQGAIKVQGPQEHIMKMDAMALLIYLEAQKAAGR